MTRRATIILMSTVAMTGIGVGVFLLIGDDEKAGVSVLAPASEPWTAGVIAKFDGCDFVDPKQVVLSTLCAVASESPKGKSSRAFEKARPELERKLAQPGSTGCESVEVGNQSIGLCIATAEPPGDEPLRSHRSATQRP